MASHSYYIFTSEKAAKDYNNQCGVAEKYQGSTEFWSDIIKHPTKSKWAVMFNAKVEIEGKQLEQLDSTWK